jgi:hypothetical protein
MFSVKPLLSVAIADLHDSLLLLNMVNELDTVVSFTCTGIKFCVKDINYIFARAIIRALFFLRSLDIQSFYFVRV